MSSGDPRFDLTRLPHGDRARLLSRIVELRDDGITCEAVIPMASPWVIRGSCPAFIAIEAAAQAAALLGPGGDEPRTGALVRARKIHCVRPALLAEAPFVVVVQRAGSAAPLFVFDVEAGDRQGRILGGQISIYLEDAESSAGHISEKQNH